MGFGWGIEPRQHLSNKPECEDRVSHWGMLVDGPRGMKLERREPKVGYPERIGFAWGSKLWQLL